MDVNQIFFLGHNKYGQAGIGQEEHNKKYSQPKQIVFKTFIKQVSCGNHHSALLTIDGLIYTMGSNIHGTLGLGNAGNINYAFRPTLVKDLKDVDQVTSGSYHMCAVKQGQLYTWGKGIDGQLGHGNMKNVFAPTKVQALGNDVQSVSCGMNHTLVIVSKKINNLNVYAFGSGIYGQLGCGSNRSYNYPINIKLSNVESVSAGENHSLFISQGNIYGCGDNSSFQVGSFEDSNKNKKYILQPVRLQFFSNQEINFIDCHHLSVALTSNNKAFVWGGKCKIWPPLLLDEKQVVNLQVTSEKIYCINGNNQLVSISFRNTPRFQQQKQILLKNRNVLDFDAGEHHMLAVGDIVAQTDDKEEVSTLSLWTGESLKSSKQTFSQKNINQQTQMYSQQPKTPIHENMPDFYFTRHLQSGMSEQESFKNESQVFKRKQKHFQSAQQSAEQSINYQTSIMNTNTYENISSQIEIESKNPFQINESETKKYFEEKDFTKLQNKIPTTQLKVQPFNIQHQLETSQNKRYSENKLQKLMDQMEIKTVHLKKYFPIQEKQNQQKRINKTPSSYIKKEPENFVLQSEQVANQLQTDHLDPKISNFQERLQMGLPLREIQLQQNKLPTKREQKGVSKPKSRAKSIIYYNQRQNLSEEQQQVSGCFKQPIEANQKTQGPSIQSIFMQLLKKQKKQKPSNQKVSKVPMHRDFQQVPKRNNRLSHSCISSKHTEPSTSRFQKDQTEFNELPKLVPIAQVIRTPVNETKLAISKISDNSNISAKSNFRKNTDILQISRSNRELRFELRGRDLKISNLQEQLSKKQIEVEMLYKQLDYFKNLVVNCQQCGVQTIIQDPFASV